VAETLFHRPIEKQLASRKQKTGKPGNLITLIKLPGLPQYYVNRFTPPP